MTCSTPKLPARCPIGELAASWATRRCQKRAGPGPITLQFHTGSSGPTMLPSVVTSADRPSSYQSHKRAPRLGLLCERRHLRRPFRAPWPRPTTVPLPRARRSSRPSTRGSSGSGSPEIGGRHREWRGRPPSGARRTVQRTSGSLAGIAAEDRSGQAAHRVAWQGSGAVTRPPGPGGCRSWSAPAASATGSSRSHCLGVASRHCRLYGGRLSVCLWRRARRRSRNARASHAGTERPDTWTTAAGSATRFTHHAGGRSPP